MPLDPAVAAVRLAVRRDLAAVGPADGPVLVGCSGGADSLALLAAAVFEARSAGWRVIGVTVDHDLQEGSSERAGAVVDQMAALGAHETMAVRVHVEAPGMGPEAAAREARYAALGQAAASLGAAAVLLGHTLDDQAETVLMGLTRGSGGRSIAGMRRSFEVYRRPLLDLTRAQTEAACRAEGMSWWSDPHNDDPRFLRSRVRHTVLPLLEQELGPGVATTLARTADQLRVDMEALDDLADAAFGQLAEGEGTGTALSLAGLAAHPAAVVGRVVRRAALAAGAPASELFAVHVEGLLSLVIGTVRGEVQLPGRVTAYVDGRPGDGHLRFRPTPVAG
ncbi:tRNA lysidine(34) synthetase TilS [Nocardioides guangzhouensis]|uniref:tRNA(Ile)-lysidine synthase n=1 Tax=Nocardioides guangzhouensis TaxID=2497878 RepID=A0A4Q4ZIG9_9ACTN|nr:tRNA lysidine(34) synthetase TilS [Nocardioides guangzhouensis]RYP88042.1 tRNA lysidine(34) synthetase TilS [Nocardioides guangzhouensis]